MARRSKFTPQVQKQILALLRDGNTRTTAATASGIGLTTFMTWLAQGRSSSAGSFREFWEAVEKAEAIAVSRSVHVIRRAAEESWQAAAWWLERRYPDEWGRRDRVEIETIIRREAEELARETGLDVDQIVAETESIYLGAGGRN